MLVVHDPRCADYGSAMRPEQPARTERTAARLKERHPTWNWVLPQGEPSDEELRLAHSEAMIRRLDVPRDIDEDTPYFAGIGGHARRSVAAALTAARHARAGKGPAFSLMRPPGHHATGDQSMGFCYLNSIAIAALDARRAGAQRVAVWDFDAHHGNGTEAILRDQPGCLFTSVHQLPGYPGTGATSEGNCLNWPVPPRCPRDKHVSAVKAAWQAIIAFKPDLVLVSAGFDAYKDDPITAMMLEAKDFQSFGGWLKDAGLPTAAILEGGYSAELPGLVDVFLSAWAP